VAELTMNREILSLTSLRGLAALYVLLFHFEGAYGPIFYPLSKVSKIIEHGYLGVDVFFILSGFIIYHVYGATFEKTSPTHIRSFLVARFARIWPLHTFMLLLWLCGIIGSSVLRTGAPPIGGFRFFGGNDAISFGTNILMIHAWGFHDALTWNRVSWSVSAEWFAYLAFPIVLVAFRRLGTIVKTSVLAVATFSVLMVAVHIHGNLETMMSGWSLLRVECEFVIGMCVYRAYEGLQATNMTPRTVDLLTLTLTASFLTIVHMGAPDILVVPMVAALIPVLALTRGRISDLLSRQTLVYLGTISYSIYMVHLAVRTLYVEVVKPHLGTVLSASYPLSAAAMGIVVAITLTMAALAYHLVEKPARSAIRAAFG
jgi:peptidoglycan/LPS O-acetylase OafA/YrhL